MRPSQREERLLVVLLQFSCKPSPVRRAATVVDPHHDDLPGGSRDCTHGGEIEMHGV